MNGQPPSKEQLDAIAWLRACVVAETGPGFMSADRRKAELILEVLDARADHESLAALDADGTCGLCQQKRDEDDGDCGHTGCPYSVKSGMSADQSSRVFNAPVARGSMPNSLAESTDPGERLASMPEGRSLVETAAIYSGAAHEPKVKPVTDLTQYRCQPEKKTYCSHMDLAHDLLAEWVKAWDAGSNETLYARTQALLLGAEHVTLEHGRHENLETVGAAQPPGADALPLLQALRVVQQHLGQLAPVNFKTRESEKLAEIAYVAAENALIAAGDKPASRPTKGEGQ